jgi:hypothetical protein
MPGHRIIERAARMDMDVAAKPDAVTPDLAALRRKFLGPKSAEAAVGTEIPSSEAKDDVEIVWVQPNDAVHGDPKGAPKAVVVSKTKQKIIGMQG